MVHKNIFNLFANKKIIKIAHNLKFDMQMLANLDIKVEKPYYDTLIASFILEPNNTHSLDT